MEQEHASDRVAEGRELQEEAYPDRSDKDILLGGLVRLDGLEESGGKEAEAVITVHETKLSRKATRAQRFQLLYYLYFLKRVGVRNVRGLMEYPRLKRREEIVLTPKDEAELEGLLRRIDEVRDMPSPPEVAEPMGICSKCAYQELCWG